MAITHQEAVAIAQEIAEKEAPYRSLLDTYGHGEGQFIFWVDYPESMEIGPGPFTIAEDTGEIKHWGSSYGYDESFPQKVATFRTSDSTCIQTVEERIAEMREHEREFERLWSEETHYTGEELTWVRDDMRRRGLLKPDEELPDAIRAEWLKNE